jgi:hypothetical protein
VISFTFGIGDTRPSPFSHRSSSFFPGPHNSHSLHSPSHPSSTLTSASASVSASASGSGARPSLLNGYQHPVSTSRGTYADSPPQSPVERGVSQERDGHGDGDGDGRSRGLGGGVNGHDRGVLPPPHSHHLERSHTHSSLLSESRHLPSLHSPHARERERERELQRERGQDVSSHGNGNGNGLRDGRSSSGISLPPIGAALTPRGTMMLPSRSRDRPSPMADPRADPSTSTSHPSGLSISGIERAGPVRRDKTREATRPDSPPPVGSCPGDGRCNGTGGKMGCEGCPTYNNSSSKVVLDEQQQQQQSTCAGSARRQQEQAVRDRERYALGAGGGSPMEGVEPGYNPLIAASHAQNMNGKSSVRSPGSKSARYTDEEGQ